ncbi:prepilin-type N-terminal cleavage/methylation domain-containing protein [Candidatus Microgenomates bacterium]|nr:MAG: prepilin-type N-terminal cleavage/methylation domain-containing protein [Candidatus Microgenomates bacterium]
MKFSSRRGFTLIEMIVVVAIFAIISTLTILVIGPRAQLQKANDAKRQNDLQKIKTSLDAFYNDHNKYPLALGELSSGNYIKSIPKDPSCPKTGTCSKDYVYLAENNNSNPQWFTLFSSKESKDLAPNCPYVCAGVDSSVYNFCSFEGSVSSPCTLASATPSCTPRPGCLDALPHPCKIPEPAEGWCLAPTITPIPTPAGKTYFVSPVGLDTNSGTESDPLKTIQKAADIVNPGDTVIVKDGNYTDNDGNNYIVTTSRSGTADKWITFKSEHKWGAILDGENNKTRYGWAFGGSYVRVENFELKDLAYAGFHSNGAAQNVYVFGNHIHDIARMCSSVPVGLDGIYIGVNSSYITFDSNLWHDIGRFHQGENGCAYPTGNRSFGENLDHAIYIDTSHITIINNIFYNIGVGWPIQICSSHGYSMDDIKVINNTFAYRNPYRNGQIIICDNTSNITIENNIFYQPTSAAIDFFYSGNAQNIQIKNNITTAEKLYLLEGTSTPVITESANLISTDPIFIDPVNYLFRLQSNSPAIDAGRSENVPLLDYNGIKRPQKSGFDIGAFEFK